MTPARRPGSPRHPRIASAVSSAEQSADSLGKSSFQREASLELHDNALDTDVISAWPSPQRSTSGRDASAPGAPELPLTISVADLLPVLAAISCLIRDDIARRTASGTLEPTCGEILDKVARRFWDLSRDGDVDWVHEALSFYLELVEEHAGDGPRHLASLLDLLRELVAGALLEAAPFLDSPATHRRFQETGATTIRKWSAEIGSLSMSAAFRARSLEGTVADHLLSVLLASCAL